MCMCASSVVNDSCQRVCYVVCFFFQAEDGIRDLVRSRGLGDVYKRQGMFGFVLQVQVASDAQHRRRQPLHDEQPLPAVQLSLIHI